MARKPLLTGPVLNREDVQSRLAGDDLMSRVIENDAAKHGRAASPPPSASDGPPEVLQERNLTTLQENLIPSKEESKEDLKVSDKVSDKLPGGGGPSGAPPNALLPRTTDRETRLARAMGVAAEDEMIVVSVRVPGKLNDYIDQYVARVAKSNPKRRYRKQDAMAEALAGFIADHPMPTVSVEEEF